MALIANTYHIYNCKLPFHVLFIIQYTCMYAQTHTHKRTWLMCCVSISLWCRSSKKTVSTTVYRTFYYIYVTFFPSSTVQLIIIIVVIILLAFSLAYIVGAYMNSAPVNPSHHFGLFFPTVPFHIFSLLFMWLTCYENKVNVCKKILVFNSHFRSIFKLMELHGANAGIH